MPFVATRRRLVAWNVLVFALVLAAMIGVAIGGEVRAHDAAIERDLRAALAQAAAALEHGDSPGRVYEERGEHRNKRDKHGDRDEHRQRDDEREGASAPDAIVFSKRAGESSKPGSAAATDAVGLPDEAALDSALAGVESWSERVVGTERYRLLSSPVAHEGRVIGAVQVAARIGADRRVLSRSILILLVTGAVGLVAGIAGSAFLATRAMTPIAAAFERQRRFLADASHELRTPVAVVRARAELLARDADELPPAVREELGRLDRDAAELAALLDQLLDLSRLDAGAGKLTLEPVPLADVVDELAEQVRPLATARGVALKATTSPTWARADLSRVRQVLRALVDNALKHTPAGGSVRLSVTTDDGVARLEVADDGEGIAPEHLPRVRERFYRADEARTRKPSDRGGAGLGLAIASELARLMGGTLTLDSVVGRGTTAVVRLPLADRRSAPPGSSAES